MSSARLSIIAPGLFVLLWSSGFLGAKAGTAYAEPFTFLSLRVGIVIALMLALAVVLQARWPRRPRDVGHIALSGVLLHGGYLAGCFSAVYHGMSAGVIALIVGLQPIVTAFAAAPLLGERVSTLQWIGLALGFGGVVLVVAEKISGDGLSGVSIAWALVALCSITAGTLYQKRFCPSFDMRSGAVIQFSAALGVLLPLALLLETRHVTWNGEFVFALTWLVLAVSVGAISLLFYLIEHGEATRVASLFYLTPVTTAVMAWFLFGEKLGGLAIVGMASTIVGVALVNRKTGLVQPEP